MNTQMKKKAPTATASKANHPTSKKTPTRPKYDGGETLRQILDEAWVEARCLIEDTATVDPFGDLTKVRAHRVRKDVAFSIESVRVEGDSIAFGVTVDFRGNTYRGVVRHRLPLVASVGNPFVFDSTPISTTVEGKLLPSVAGALVTNGVAVIWSIAFDESSPTVVEALRDLAIQTHGLDVRGGKYRHALAMIESALVALDK